MGAMRLLVVEDDRKVRAFLEKGLREEQYAVDSCATGPEAIDLAAIHPYDLVILDVMLPGRDGFSVCREFRDQGLWMPVLMLTARDALKDKINGLSEGADDYLTKPFSFEELLARIRALFRRSQEYRVGRLAAADLEIDPVRRSVTRAGKRIVLTGREYALLEYLVRNKDRVVSSTMILEHVWDMNYEGTGNVVNVFINRLRDKIDKGAAKKLIRTVRGYGFTVGETDEN
jgi:DNA-binding response OmpR family regulator